MTLFGKVCYLISSKIQLWVG